MIGNTQQLNPIFGFMSSFQSNGLLIDVNCDSQFNRVDGFDIYKTKPIYINKKKQDTFYPSDSVLQIPHRDEPISMMHMAVTHLMRAA